MDGIQATDDVGVLPGVTARRREALARLGVDTIDDLLRLAPRRHEDRRHPTPISALVPGETALVIGEVEQARVFRTRSGLSIHEARVADAAGRVSVRWFQRGYVPKPLAAGRRVALYGAVTAGRGGALEMKAPQLERLDDEGDASPGAGRLVPVHPLTSGLTAPVVRRLVWTTLEAGAAASLEEVLPERVRRALELPSVAEAAAALHFPDRLEAAEAARRRFAFDELVVHEVLLAARRRARRRLRAVPLPIDERVDARIRARLPFALTRGQEAAVGDIRRDLAAPHPMFRLLQGDVGSGKTAVAAYAMLAAVAGGHQAAFLAPTDVLARQHAETLTGLLEGSRVRIVLLTGALKAAERREAQAAIERGEADLVIATHAVLGRDVTFASLALAVIDEQHKFGVEQQGELIGKARGKRLRPHTLVMTATPIPRTLALTVYGDLDVSVIPDRPPGRTPVETWVVRPKEAARVLERVRSEIAAGRQAFVIYPLVEESARLSLRDAKSGAERWTRALPDARVGLLHGRMKRAEKEGVMDAFRARDVDVLVSTVVVEVGVDVANATVLVVEHAERFGLSQLHQLRGRVGRGRDGGCCVLVDRSQDGETARLGVLAETDDGFEIAEADLLLRGTGDVLGTRQHGRPAFCAARLPRDLALLEQARRVAEDLLASDPRLQQPEHRALAHAARRRARRDRVPKDGDAAGDAPPR